VLDVDADPTTVAQYAAQRSYYLRKGRTTIVEKYLTDKFALAQRLDLRRLRRRNVGYLLVRNPAYIAALNANPHVARDRTFGAWRLFDVV
jgi:hypothetical protein